MEVITMSKTTIILNDYLISELQKMGHSDVIAEDKQHLLSTGSRLTFMKKILHFDEDVYNIMNNLFLENELDNITSDKNFKRAFTLYFLNREIAGQTIELFSAKLFQAFESQKKMINVYYDELDSYLNNVTDSSSDETGGTLEKYRQLSTTLPQDIAQMNVDEDMFEYPDDNQASNRKTDKNGKTTSKTSQKNLDNLMKLHGLLDSIFNVFDRKCFLQYER